MLQLGTVQLEAPVFLAPMSGATDAPFRRQASRFGAPAAVTEMIAGAELVRGRRDMLRRLAPHAGSGPFIVQLAGREERWMRESAAIACDAGADIIDINMGCPSRQVTGGQSGCALMRDLDLARRLISATISGAAAPVTLKMRLGWDDDTVNAPELARIAAGEGVEMVTVHGRTRQQFYNGRASWSKVRSVVDAMSLPVIVNGDIDSPKSAREAMAQSGAAGVMIGRSALGAPWKLGEVAADLLGRPWRVPSPSEQISALAQQVGDSVDLYGLSLGLRIVRKHISAFIQSCGWLGLSEIDNRRVRGELCRIDDRSELFARLDGLLDRYAAESFMGKVA